MPKKPAVVQRDANWLDLFLEFTSMLTVDSKETGRSQLRLYNSQRRFLAELVDGLDRGIHTFICLKARQLGITTISLAVDLFWLATHPGTQGVLVADTEGNRTKFRVTINHYLQSLPRSHRIGVGNNNRDLIEFKNGSILDLLVAGTRATGRSLGVGRAYNFAHLTEVSNYGSYEGLVSLMATFAEKHPDRLFIFESTAKGFNGYWSLWQQALADAITQKAFFIGWWAKEEYSLEAGSELYEKYWDGSLDPEEQAKVNEVWSRYRVHIAPEQLAWYRWKAATRVGDQSMMAQEFPWTDDEAFIQTGRNFFPAKRIALIMRHLTDNPPPFRAYAYELAERFQDCKVRQVNDPADAELKVWEEPSPHGIYAVGVDPAYGRSENQDRSVVEVWRCFADRFVQVAEFATPNPESYQVAWVVAHLCGAYKNVWMNMEITGPGEATMLELKHLRQLCDAGAIRAEGQGENIEDLFGAAKWYMYHRSDSPGPGYAWFWKTTDDNKAAIMNQLRDSVSVSMVDMRSMGLVAELHTIVQDGRFIGPSLESGKDDRTIATALAHRTWVDWIRPGLIDEDQTWEKVRARETAEIESGQSANMVSWIVGDYFTQMFHARQEAAIEAAWEE